MGRGLAPDPPLRRNAVGARLGPTERHLLTPPNIEY
jgi:hypothetical protein